MLPTPRFMVTCHVLLLVGDGAGELPSRGWKDPGDLGSPSSCSFLLGHQELWPLEIIAAQMLFGLGFRPVEEQVVWSCKAPYGALVSLAVKRGWQPCCPQGHRDERTWGKLLLLCLFQCQGSHCTICRLGGAPPAAGLERRPEVVVVRGGYKAPEILSHFSLCLGIGRQLLLLSHF